MIKQEHLETLDRIFSYIDNNFDRMTEDLCRLASFPSVGSCREGLDASRDFIINLMERLGLTVQTGEVPGGNSLISGCSEGGCKNTVLFYNHYDVVPAGDRSQWDSDPFKPEIKDGKITARGISDNKGCLMARLSALEALRAAGAKLPVNLKFLFEGDEELGSPSMKRFSRENPEKFREMTSSDICFWENSRTGKDGTPWASFGVRGDLEFELTCEPIAFDVHARNGILYQNAAWRLIWALSSMKDPQTERVLIDGFYDKVLPTTQADRDVLREFPFDEKEAMESVNAQSFLLNKTGQELKERLYLEPSFTVNGFESGEVYRPEGARHIVPHRAYAKVSCNLVADQDPEEIFGLVRRHLDRHGFTDIRLTMTDALTAVRTPTDLPFTGRLKEAAKLVYPHPLLIELTMLGPGPAAVLRQAWPKLPIVGIGPAGTSCGHHSPNENLRLEDYKNSIKYTATVLFALENAI